MTQTVINTLNKFEQIFQANENGQKVSETISSGMDKTKDFTKVFESTLDKKTATVDDLKTNNDNIKNDEQNNTIASKEFKQILEQATDEANIESSLDLTLAKDINEIISQLKEAVENAAEIVEEDSVEEDSVEEISVNADVLNLGDESNVELENTEETVSGAETIIAEDSEQKIPFEQILKFTDKVLVSPKEIDVLNSQKEIEDTYSDDIELTLDSLIEFEENLVDEVVVSKSTDELENAEADFIIDEEVVKELKIESISAESNSSDSGNFMQHQTPEEHAVKAMINQEIESLEIKIDSTQNSQMSQQVQTKATDVNPSRILEQITKQFEALQNNSKVNIVLNPESLGKVNIQLLNTKDGLTAQFVVTTQEARDLLTKGLDGLKESLGTYGVSVDNVSVKVADSEKSEYRQDWTEQDGSRGGNKQQGQSSKEEKEKGLFEKMMAQTTENENGNV